MHGAVLLWERDEVSDMSGLPGPMQFCECCVDDDLFLPGSPCHAEIMQRVNRCNSCAKYSKKRLHFIRAVGRLTRYECMNLTQGAKRLKNAMLHTVVGPAVKTWCLVAFSVRSSNSVPPMSLCSASSDKSSMSSSGKVESGPARGRVRACLQI